MVLALIVAFLPVLTFADTLERTANRLADRTVREVRRLHGATATGAIRTETGGDGLQSAFVARFVERVQTSGVIDLDARASRATIEEEIVRLSRGVRALPPERQQEILPRIVQLINQSDYDFWIIPTDTSDEEYYSISVQVIHGRHLGTTRVMTARVHRNLVRGEASAVEIAGAYAVRLSGTDTVTAGGDQSDFDVDQSAAVASVAFEAPGVVLTGQYAFGTVQYALPTGSFSGHHRDLIAFGEGVLVRLGPIGLAAHAAYSDVTEQITADDQPESLETRAAFRSGTAGIGVNVNNLVNGVSVFVEKNRSEAVDESADLVFAGGSALMWDDEGDGVHVRARRTTSRWDVDVGFSRERFTRTFDSRYFPGFGSADLQAQRVRVEFTFRANSNFGIGLFVSRSEQEFLDTADVASSIRELSTTDDTLVGLRVSGRWYVGGEK